MGVMGGFELMMPFLFLVPLTTVSLVVLGILWMVRTLRQPVQTVNSRVYRQPVAASHADAVKPTVCPNCPQTVEPSWSHCAHCGAPLSGE
jgi:hypothetical protein